MDEEEVGGGLTDQPMVKGKSPLTTAQVSVSLSPSFKRASGWPANGVILGATEVLAVKSCRSNCLWDGPKDTYRPLRW